MCMIFTEKYYTSWNYKMELKFITVAKLPLLPYEPCDLGSLNLHAFYDEKTKGINYEFLEFAVRNAVRFLDNIHDISEIPIVRN